MKLGPVGEEEKKYAQPGSCVANPDGPAFSESEPQLAAGVMRGVVRNQTPSEGRVMLTCSC